MRKYSNLYGTNWIFYKIIQPLIILKCKRPKLRAWNIVLLEKNSWDITFFKVYHLVQGWPQGGVRGGHDPPRDQKNWLNIGKYPTFEKMFVNLTRLKVFDPPKENFLGPSLIKSVFKLFFLLFFYFFLFEVQLNIMCQ